LTQSGQSQCGQTSAKFIRASPLLLSCGDVLGDKGRIVTDTRE
jgi:hypothetical protein